MSMDAVDARPLRCRRSPGEDRGMEILLLITLIAVFGIIGYAAGVDSRELDGPGGLAAN
jgi:hypothetical protein